MSESSLNGLERSDPSRIDGRPEGFIDAKSACRRLGVKPATLYTYVSRGRVRAIRSQNRRERLYLADDVERLAQRAEARRGHRAVAVGALRFGEPVLDSAITRVGEAGLAYRGADVIELVERKTPFEEVAERLWAINPANESWPWPEREPPSEPKSPLARLAIWIPQLALDDRDRARHGGASDVHRARRLVRAIAWGLGSAPKSGRPQSIAETAAMALGAGVEAAEVIEAALVLVADHELNVSSFAARVTASGGADLYACVGAALAALSGPRHGGACLRVEALVDEVQSARRARDVVGQKLERGDIVPGFGHPLYPRGDPRSPPLLARALRSLGGSSQRLDTLLAISEVMESWGCHPMNLDGALVALALALDLPRGSATALFAAGRSAGWIGHVFEQRSSGALLRPRARYVGPP